MDIPGLNVDALLWEEFNRWTVTDLRRWLRNRGVRSNDLERHEIVKLACLTHQLKIPKSSSQADIEREAEDRLEGLLATLSDKTPHPREVTDWKEDLLLLPDVYYNDIYNYLIDSPSMSLT